MSKRDNIIEDKGRRRDNFILINGLVALILLGVAVVNFRSNLMVINDHQARQAYERMEDALSFIAGERAEAGHKYDKGSDPFGTMLIGPELTEITTTQGNPAAKRTTLQPSFAALIVKIMKEAGVEEGDRIALGCSGSFPGLLIAALSAGEAMNLETITILSLGASSYGATDPDFTILDLHMMLWSGGFTRYPPAAVSPGGNRDIASELEQEAVKGLSDKAENYRVPFIMEGDLEKNRSIRDSVYSNGGGKRPVLFINSGGSYANMGSSNVVLSLSPGLLLEATIPSQKSRGVIHDMLEKDIPVIHLLNIKGFTARYGIPWDGRADAEGRFTNQVQESALLPVVFAIGGLAWFVGIILILLRMPFYRK